MGFVIGIFILVVVAINFAYSGMQYVSDYIEKRANKKGKEEESKEKESDSKESSSNLEDEDTETVPGNKNKIPAQQKRRELEEIQEVPGEESGSNQSSSSGRSGSSGSGSGSSSSSSGASGKSQWEEYDPAKFVDQKDDDMKFPDNSSSGSNSS